MLNDIVTDNVSCLWISITSKHSNERQTGVKHLRQHLVISASLSLCIDTICFALNQIEQYSRDHDTQWYILHGNLLVIDVCVSLLSSTSFPTSTSTTISIDKYNDTLQPILSRIHTLCCSTTWLLEHTQLRIRQAFVCIVDSLAATSLCSTSMFNDMMNIIIDSIEHNFERGNDNDASSVISTITQHKNAQHEDRIQRHDGESAAELTQRLHQHGLRPNAEGWKALETSLNALQHLIGAYSREQLTRRNAPNENNDMYLDIITSSSSPSSSSSSSTRCILPLLTRACQHCNRFVREAAYMVLSVLVTPHQSRSEQQHHTLVTNVLPLLASGLADNWSQVRLAASVATRAFVVPRLHHHHHHHHNEDDDDDKDKDMVYASLIPGMCLNRYYVAEGVRNYSLDTWRIVSSSVDGGGKALLSRYANITVMYYVAQARADNHAVREAACYCMAELATKIGGDSFRMHVHTLLNAMLDCFRDESWPVRDASCVALGDFVSAYPSEALHMLPLIEQLWIQHLADNIASVRLNSAVALGKTMSVYGDEFISRINNVITRLLPEAHKQPLSTRRTQTMRNTSEFGVCGAISVKNNNNNHNNNNNNGNSATTRDDDDENDAAHTDQMVYSCGSLAPKLRRGGGCMDHGFQRHREPWESTDGAIHLLAELAPRAPLLAQQHFDTLHSVAQINTFAQHGLLRKTIFSNIVRIAQGVGRKHCKQFLCLFGESLVSALDDHNNRLAQYAAAHALEELSSWLGHSIFIDYFSTQQQSKMQQSSLVNFTRVA